MNKSKWQPVSLQLVQRTLRAKQRDHISPGFSLRTTALPSQRAPWALGFLPRGPKRSNASTDFIRFPTIQKDSICPLWLWLWLVPVELRFFGGRVQVKIEYSIFLDGCSKEKALVRGLAPKKGWHTWPCAKSTIFHHKTRGNCVTTFPSNRALLRLRTPSVIGKASAQEPDRWSFSSDQL